MKAALITEEQIAKVKDGLSMIASSQEHADAMEILRSLKPQEPAVWRYMPSTFMSGFVLTDDPSRVKAVKSLGDKFILEGLYAMVNS